MFGQCLRDDKNVWARLLRSQAVLLQAKMNVVMTYRFFRFLEGFLNCVIFSTVFSEAFQILCKMLSCSMFKGLRMNSPFDFLLDFPLGFSLDFL